MTHQLLLCRTDSVRQTSYKKMAKHDKKVDMVNIENPFTKEIRLL